MKYYIQLIFDYSESEDEEAEPAQKKRKRVRTVNVGIVLNSQKNLFLIYMFILWNLYFATHIVYPPWNCEAPWSEWWVEKISHAERTSNEEAQVQSLRKSK